MSDRIFIKVDPSWLERLDAYCQKTGMTRSGAVRAALEKPMADSERKGSVPVLPAWGNMTQKSKIDIIRAAGPMPEAIGKVAETLRVPHDTVQRFAYRNGLIGPGAVAAAE